MNFDWFSFWSGINPNHPAVTTLTDQQTYTYGDLQDRANRTANLLLNQYEIQKGDRVAILAKNCIEYINLFGAAQKLGLIIVPFNYRLTQHELDQLIDDVQPSLMIVEDEFQLTTASCPVISLEVFSSSILSNEGIDVVQVPIEEDDPIFILYTSGSTGIPKGVMYSHKMLFWNSVNTSVSLGVNSESIALVCMPPFHTGGWNVLLTPLLHHGGHVVLSQKFDAEEVLNNLSKYQCNQFMAVPTMLKMMAQLPNFGLVRLDQLKYIIVGGEAMPLELIELYEQHQIAVRQGFGMTEVGPNLTSLHHSQSRNKIGSIGKPNMYVEVKLFNEEGVEVKKGELGELCFAGPVVMKRYWGKPANYHQLYHNKWFRSGDIATMDDEGYLYIKDRIKNMFISGGENVYPAEIEKLLLTHPYIEEAAVLGTPDPKWGEVGKAFIKSSRPLTQEEVNSFCKNKLSKYKIPKHYVFLDELPINSTGKFDRNALKAMP